MNVRPPSNNDRPILSKEQFRAVEQLFPARVIPHTATEAELREYMGTQKVIAELRRRVG